MRGTPTAGLPAATLARAHGRCLVLRLTRGGWPNLNLETTLQGAPLKLRSLVPQVRVGC